MLDITAKMAGVVTGAFGDDGTLYGFVYGITGFRRGEPAHWSHMLAVRPEARDRGIGRRLKRAQRRELLTHGVKTMYWTFDPLVARNAHLNINLLGTRIDEFVPDMYGDSDSKLHQLGTDRFIVRWDLMDDSPVTGSGRATGDDARPTGDQPEADNPHAIKVPIPSDIEAVQARSFEDAIAWRRSTRRSFNRLRDGSWEVAAFVPGDEQGHYVMVRTTTDTSTQEH